MENVSSLKSTEKSRKMLKELRIGIDYFKYSNFLQGIREICFRNEVWTECPPDKHLSILGSKTKEEKLNKNHESQKRLIKRENNTETDK